LKPYYDHAGITLYHGDCREILPTLPKCDATITDPPYLTSEKGVPIVGGGVAPRICDSNSVEMPWGYDLEWIEHAIPEKHWLVFANYKMLGGVCSRLPPQTVFVWKKNNAPRMTRPVPRLDCEFIIWSRTGGKCDRMGEFQSMVIDVLMPQAGCFASERILEPGTGKGAHPCQKPLGIVRPFIARIDAETILDPFAGSGTTLVAAKLEGRKAIGIEISERYCEIAASRLAQGVLF
jgi:site-specific DNA-methyltransferase (adenine-specific)